MTPAREKIAQAISDVALRNSGVQFPVPFTGVGPAPKMPWENMAVMRPMPRPRPNIEPAPQQPSPYQAMASAGGGQPMQILPEAFKTFAGAKGPQWTDQEYENFWARSNPTG